MFVRRCPKCKKKIVHRNKRSYKHSVLQNIICVSCSHIGMRFSRKHKNNIRKSKLGKSLSRLHRERLRVVGAGFSSIEEYRRMYPKKLQYIADVMCETKKSIKENPPLKNFEKRGRAGVKGAYQLDHIISVHKGFLNGTESTIIGGIRNLRMIPWRENMVKGSK